jgi:hypothetical protein
VTNNSFKVLWTPVTNGESDLKFLLVWFTGTEKEKCEPIQYEDNDEMEFVIPNLKEATSYKVKICAEIKDVKSEFTKPLTVKTLGKLIFK